ncbi:MAG: hypothetical protein LBK67_12030, partial [Coriobacteriales bacterium]|nr:hypothetical protein [Coriobacteriales bacterium]
YSPAAIRRLGWLLEHYTDAGGLDDLASVASRSAPTPSLLDSFSPLRGSLDKRWMIRLNTEVEIEESFISQNNCCRSGDNLFGSCHTVK